MFNVIGSAIGKIFGTEKALTSIVTGASKAIDALVYTEEEKVNDALKDRSAARGMVIKWMESTKGQNLARRLIALSIVSVWLFQYLSCTILSVAGIWLAETEKINASAGIIGKSAEALNGPIMLILGFYFAAPYMGDIAKGALKNFGKKK